MKKSLVVLMCIAALCIGASYVSADAGSPEKVLEVLMNNAMASYDLSLDVYCITLWPQGEPYVSPGWLAVDAQDGNISDRVVLTYFKVDDDGSELLVAEIDVGELWSIWREAANIADAAGNPAKTEFRTVVITEPPEVPDTDPPELSPLGCGG